MISELMLKDGTRYEGVSFGANIPVSGEVVFITGMVGYPESFTDPSFKGQILVMTYPLLGNYGVPDKKTWESDRVQISGLVVCNYIDTPSHHSSQQTLAKWLKQQGVPALEIKDTRGLTQKLRTHGVMLGRFVIPAKSRLKSGHEPEAKKIDSLRRLADRGNDKEQEFQDPNLRNLVAEVSCKKPYIITPSTSLKAGKTVALIDCGAKFNIARSLAKRGVKVLVVPWQTDVLKLKQKIHGVMISNGPGDPQMAKATIENVKKLLAKKTAHVWNLFRQPNFSVGSRRHNL
jgi:carbamoyl-phosphate synthase small subunit